MPDPAILLDADLRPVNYNSLYVQLTGHRASALGRLFRDEVSPFSVVGHAAKVDEKRARQCISTGKPLVFTELPLTNAVGQSFVVLQVFLPVSDDPTGAASGVLVWYRDLSAEAAVQARYRDLIAKEKARAAELGRLVEERTQQLRTALDEVTRLSTMDPLTNVLNRRAFTDHFQQALGLAQRHQRCLALLMCDLDFFKSVNDRHGHQTGDAILVSVAQALKGCIRETDKVGRFGGEEFLVLLAETTAAGVLEVAQRCLEAVREIPVSEIVPGATFRQTVSIGVAWYPDHGGSLDELTARADEAMYRAKSLGRDRVVRYEPALEDTKTEEKRSVSQLTANRLLWVGPPQPAVVETLETRFALVKAQSPEDALLLCERNLYEIVVAAPELADAGVELLRRLTRVSPSSLRVMLSSAREGGAGRTRGQSVIHVDLFLSLGDPSERLLEELENGLLRRELLKSRLLCNRSPWPEVGADEIVALEEILEAQHLAMAYQPIVAASDRRVVGFEALCRPSGCFSGPTALIETAFQSGLLWELGRLIRKQVIKALEQLPDEQLLFVNLHPAEVSDEQLLQGEPILRPFAHRLVFEITERAAIQDPQSFQSEVAALRQNGYRVAIDDLGAGYASLNSVALLEPDFVKIDQFLIRGIDSSRSRQALVGSIIEACNSEHIEVIAEGIETVEERDVSVALGCSYLQGFAIGRPSEVGSGPQTPRRPARRRRRDTGVNPGKP